MSSLTMSATTNRPTRAPRRKRPPNPNWREEFYRNGYPQEIIVIEDSPTPPVNQQIRPLAPLVDRGMKRTRRTPPLPSAYTYYPHPQLPTQQISTVPMTKRRRKGEVPLSQNYAPYNPSYNDNSYRSYISTSSHASTSHLYREQIPSRESYSSGASSRLPPMPVYDDKDGHYIVHPGDDLTSRYKIIRLLGQGTFGKVVQCWDRANNRHVAIKIIRAVQKYRDASKIEIRVLECIKQKDPENLNRCIHLRDCFDFRNHICMVFDLLGSSLFDFLKANDFNPFPLNQIQHIAKQLLSSVDFLHNLGLVHTDLKPENILLDTDHYRSIPSKGRKDIRELYNSDIRLIDFGSATFDDEYHSSVVSTRHYRAPEVILGLGWSYPCDLWSIGCILVELFTGEALFQTHENLEHLAMMEQVLGKIPERLILRAGRHPQAKYFKNGKLNYPNPDTNRQSKKYVRELHSLKDIIKPHLCAFNKQFYDLVLRLLDYEPTARLTTRQALRHPFFYMLDLILLLLISASSTTSTILFLVGEKSATQRFCIEKIASHESKSTEIRIFE
ncbi:hypothetical protein G9A89_021159 [Geosiphon pyriformis]|nr:hypothetical protein G9A89_021159 [Geosiphon pyriformis]